MKLGILYICIGCYDFFWESFYESSERYLMQGYPCIREYFVFTDASSLYKEEDVHIHRIYQSDMGWPDNTMKRFHLFLTIREQLKDLDYLFFFNANVEFVAPVGMDFLPDEKGNGLVGALHSYCYNASLWSYPYERRKKSMAYIPFWRGKQYYQGSLIGGTTDAFLRMCEVCNSWIDIDLKNGITPIWHDESIINRYFIDNPPKVLDCRYNYSEKRSLPIEKKIVLRNKERYFSFNEMKRPDYKSIHSSVKLPYVESAIINTLCLLSRIKNKLKRILGLV